eukprot:CAMPEP_0173368740 /NCGR_PEP_ID=MMETSP1144-20121109/25665_1 /TAXON_ID=483371 /ORGANISM="non described non described, Strain CCMP2298" /LENGTH=48 /DNA_ID= /DNA_START= /DNA_END= /DNA_ORIENTATION=
MKDDVRNAAAPVVLFKRAFSSAVKLKLLAMGPSSTETAAAAAAAAASA